MGIVNKLTMGMLMKRNKDPGSAIARVNPEEGNPLHYQTHVSGKRVPHSKVKGKKK